MRERMKLRPGVKSLVNFLAAQVVFAAALLLTSCGPAQKPFDLEKVESVHPPTNVQIVSAGNLEGVKMIIKWTPSPDDRYASGIIAVRPDAGQEASPATKHLIKNLEEKPRDDRVKYEVFRAVVEPGEDIYSLPPDRYKKIGEAREGEDKYTDEGFIDGTEPRLVLWQARRREVEKIPRKVEESGLDSEETQVSLQTWAAKGFAPDGSVDNTNFYILQKQAETKSIPITTGENNLPDAETQKSLIEAMSDGWELKGGAGAFVLARPLAYTPEVGKGKTYAYKVRFNYGDLSADSQPSLPVASTSGLFRFDRLVNFFLTIAFIVVAGYFIFSARRGKEMYIRPIAGIAAVEEAVGRATEMGRPALFCPGIGTISGPATLASLAILSKIAEKTATYDTDLMMPNYDIFVLQVAQETIKEAYLKAGRPDAYNSDMAFFMSDRQFAFAAGISGIIARRRPAAIFLLGTFYAESLLLAEAGANVGAIQIAGTDSDHQLPFFVTACDYTLIGEELYAAGAYLGRDPKLLGTLKGQDGFKAIVMILTIIIVPLVVILFATGALQIGTFLKYLFDSEFILV